MCARGVYACVCVDVRELIYVENGRVDWKSGRCNVRLNNEMRKE